ncbi:MAG: circadian clock protein KaiC, partial [Frankiaceae bacterium]|nr:circadian clock protein KaiC [Frankiaceae bacterium]
MGSATPLAKQPSGIAGLDDLTGGGYPQGRPTLVCGGAGCGKSILGMQFLVSGARDHGEAGIFLSFEEPVDDIVANAASLGWDLPSLVDAGKLLIDHVVVERNLIEEAGDYSLDGLFIRLGAAIDRIGATRVVIDTLEVLFSALANEAVVRAELTRLFRWLKDRGVTCIVTAERGDGSLTRHGLEEYVSDCVILLDHRVTEQVSTRRLRVVKYRGSAHGSNEFPFLIDASGISVVPITSAGMDYPGSEERVATGIASLDQMLGGKGYFRGSSVLVSGSAGTGKTSLAAHFASAAC